MAEKVSFKVYLKEPGREDQAEVRRFIVEKDVSTNFTYLQEKLSTVFPRLKNGIFTINWTDEDGDMVTISTDEELIIALTQMNGPLYRIQVIIKGGKRQEEKNLGNMSGEVHPNVTCDGCEMPVVGFRYKCIICNDYDLCGNCDTAGIHPGHNMLRIASPQINFPHHFFKRLHKMQERAEQRSHCRQERQENLVGEATNDNDNQFHGGWFTGFGGVGRGRAGRGMFRGRGGPRGGAWVRGPMGCGAFFAPPLGADGGAWAGTFNDMMKGWKGEEYGVQQQPKKEVQTEEERKKESNEPSPSDEDRLISRLMKKCIMLPHQDAIKAGNQAAFNAAQQGFSAMNSPEYLKNVGNFVAASLDPYGIDVQIDIETRDGKRQPVGAFANTSSSNSFSKMETKNAEEGSKKENNTESEKEMDLKVAAEDSNTVSSSDDENWTVLKESPKVVNIPIEVSDQPAMVLYASPDGTLYTNLPKIEPTTTAVAAPPATATSAPPAADAASTTTAPAASAPLAAAVDQTTTTTDVAASTTPNPPAAALVSHLDPRIKVALHAMMNMGFSNEGSWLTNLLEVKDGDIGKALDVLQPIRK